MTISLPGEVELITHFSRHLGPRFEAAGVRVQFHYNQIPGIHFKTEPSEEYREAIVRGLSEGMALHFPEFPIKWERLGDGRRRARSRLYCACFLSGFTVGNRTGAFT
jgi:hypothetical protein